VAHKVEIMPALPEHIPAIARNMRDADVHEIQLLGWASEPALRISLRTSLAAWTGLVDGIPVCMFGVCDGEMGEGKPWMLGTSKLDDPVTAIIFLRRCKKQVEIMLNLRSVLANYVSIENDRAIKWLSWLGFDIIHPSFTWGARRKPFYRFELRRKS